MTYYINRESGPYKETVDEFNDYKEARTMCAEYQFRVASEASRSPDHGRAYYYVSNTPLSNWND